MACRRCHPSRRRQPIGKTHLIIPDTQVRPGINTDHLEWIGRYIENRRPSVVVQIGDFCDFGSLSSYDFGKRQFEGRRYKNDIAASVAAMGRLTKPFRNAKGYKPRMVLTLGNHEQRLQTAIDNDAKLEGVIGFADLQYERFGWEVYPFLQPVVVDGIAYAHYFTSGIAGRPVSSASALLAKRHMSAVMGHTQQTDISFVTRADGQQLMGLMVGLCATHDEEYLGPQSNAVRRQIVVLHEVDGKGGADPMFVSLNYLKKKYS